MDYQNSGLINLHQTEQSDGTVPDTRTVIVTGVARSGTSMVARVLHGAGLFMGTQIDDVVFEDNEFAIPLGQSLLDVDAMNTLLRARDDVHPVWGLKRPHLHVHGPAAIDLFRNPAVIVIVRDPVAVAERNVIAEYLDVGRSLSQAMNDLQQMMQFVEDLTCPVLLISYEKALRSPDRFIQRLLDFCGLDVSEADRQTLAALVEPDRPAYVSSARRIFEGYIDEIKDTILVGWACQRGLDEPVTVKVMRDDQVVAHCVADQYRGDLDATGIGNGRHGFSIDLAGFGFHRESAVSVLIDGRNFTLTNSGRSVAELGADLERIEDHVMNPWAMIGIG